VPVQDVSDSARALKAMAARLWLEGLGWILVSAAGSALQRQPVDVSVGSPERLVFEGAPDLIAPLTQEGRQAVVVRGNTICTRTVFESPTLVDKHRLKIAVDAAVTEAGPRLEAARLEFNKRKATEMQQRTGKDIQECRRVVEERHRGTLLPDLALDWDDPGFDGCTVGSVLADPARFVGATLADPIDGAEYGQGKARVMLGWNDRPIIHSLAHGQSRVYRLMYDENAVLAWLAQATEEGQALVRAAALRMATAMVGPASVSIIADKVAKTSGLGVRAVLSEFKAAQAEMKKAAKDAKRRGDREADDRPEKAAPLSDAPVGEVVASLDAALSAQRGSIPPFRNGAGVIGKLIRTPDTSGTNAEAWRMGPAEILDVQVAVERACRLMRKTKDDEREVALQRHFAEALLGWPESGMPVVNGVANLPVVGYDGDLVVGEGLLREHSLIMKCPAGILESIPRHRTFEAQARESFQWLCDEWLGDVSTDIVGKAGVIACALTLIQRSMLTERPMFLFDAGLRGGGKTTAAQMAIGVVEGLKALPNPWSPEAVERKKVIFTHAREGRDIPFFDNVPNGHTLSDATFDMVCTSDALTDRVLGESRSDSIPFRAVIVLTGNNVMVSGDTASRTLQIRLEVNTPNPEDRKFRHAHPVEWSIGIRHEILRHLFNILMVDRDMTVPGKSRFKGWWALVGAPIEIASGVDLSETLKAKEAEDMNVTSAATLMTALEKAFPPSGEMMGVATRAFSSSEVTDVINGRRVVMGGVTQTEAGLEMQEALEGASAVPFMHGRPITPVLVGRRLQKLKGRPVMLGERILKLVGQIDRNGVQTWAVTGDRPNAEDAERDQTGEFDD